jgi:hypothetical protein
MKRVPLSLRLAATGAFMALLAPEAHLGAREPMPPPTKNFALVRLLDEGERPLVGATIRPTGVSTGPSTSWGGAVPPGFPDHVLSDTNGNFTLSRAEPFVRAQVHIEAPGVGSCDLWLGSSNVLTVIHLGPFEMSRPVPGQPGPGKPMPGFRPPTPGGPPLSSGPPPLARGPWQGWSNGPAPPGSWSSRAEAGRVTIRYCPYPPGQTNTATAVPAGGLNLAGQVRTRTGEPLPAGLQVNVRSGIATEHTEPDGEGHFAFKGIPAGQVTLWIEPNMEVSHEGGEGVGWTGWRLTSNNRNRRAITPRSELVGLLEAGKEDLLLMIEHAEVPWGFFKANQVPDSPEQRALWGAETSGPPFITVTGQVLDDRTGQPVTRVKVIPCRQPPVGSSVPVAESTLKQLVDAFTKKPQADRNTVYLDVSDEQISSNGTFGVEFLPLAYPPLLRFEAAGYLPAETKPFAETTNLVIRLRPGAGPAGTVLRADGQPAVGAKVVHTTGGTLAGLHNRELQAFGEDETLQVVGLDGKFAFEPSLHEGKVIAADQSGWAEANVTREDEVLKLRLRPWAAVKGRLMTTNGTPAAGMILALTWSHQFGDGTTVWQELDRTTNDVNGAFEFQNVPPRRLQLQRIALRPGSNLGPYYQQTWLVAEPGITNDLGQVICDPPPSLLETLKRQFGL